MGSSVLLAAKLVAALEEAPEDERTRALAIVRGAYPDESAECLRTKRERDAARKRGVRGMSSDGGADGGALSADGGGRGGSLSPDSSSEDSRPSQQIGEGGVTDGARVLMSADWELDEETRASASMLGIRDLDEEWTKFRAHHVAKGQANTIAGWRGLFANKWCVDSKKFAARTGGPRLARVPQPVPEGGRAWKAGE